MIIELCFVFAIVLIGHWYADFYLQSQDMAENKSSKPEWLAYHVLTYFAGFTGFSLISFGLFNFLCYLSPTLISITPLLNSVTFLGILLFSVLNAICHWATDFVTSTITSRLWKQNDIHNFFVVVGFDQLVHGLTFILFLAIFLF